MAGEGTLSRIVGRGCAVTQRLVAEGVGKAHDMLLLLMIPATLLLLTGLLAFSAYAENHMVSSRALILNAVRSPRSRPEVAEALVAREVDRLLRNGDS